MKNQPILTDWLAKHFEMIKKSKYMKLQVTKIQPILADKLAKLIIIL